MLLISILTLPLIISLTTASPLSTSLSPPPPYPNTTSSPHNTTTAIPNITSILNPINTPTPPGVVTDAFILNYILTLSFLLRALYSDALESFTRIDFVAAGFNKSFYAGLEHVHRDEKRHVGFLNNTLHAAGLEATRVLKYEFPYGNVMEFVTFAGVVEGVAVSAYLGALAHVENKEYLTALSSMLSVEAEHESFLREALREVSRVIMPDVPPAKPFGTPLGLNQTHTIAVGFIKNFQDSAVKLPVVPFPSLTLACSPAYYQAGITTVTFSRAFANARNLGIMLKTPIYAVFVSGLLKIPVRIRLLQGSLSGDAGVDHIPEGILGQSYVFLSRSNDDFSDSNTIAGPTIIQVYPKGTIFHTQPPACRVQLGDVGRVPPQLESD